MSEYETIRYDVDDGILRLVLNRPDRMNAFTVTMCEELQDAYIRASDDDAVRAIVVTGEGKAFCAGMDLGAEGNVFGLDESQRPTLADLATAKVDPAIERGVRDTGGKVTLAMYECRKPIVGAINGVAVGIGATMTLPMDFRFASTAARFGFVFGRLGIVPEAASTWFLPRIVGIEQALEWFYSAEIFDAQVALDKGLVRRLCAPETLVDEAVAFARTVITDRSPVSVALIRQMTWRNSAQPHPRHAHDIDSLAVFYTALADGAEGVQAFLDKRPAAFASRASDMPAFYPWQDEHGQPRI
ncbi:MAG TPA: crotonase/enoyl-CoA hydratase family protein [Croceicoccus sp.]|nr:crotonase/enoyl-CoA hydratase family protein [Croceicoccus sp.]